MHAADTAAAANFNFAVAIMERAIYHKAVMPERAKNSMISRPERALVIVGFAPLFAQLLGSTFNIWYNIVHVQPLLTPEQLARFFRAINCYNLIAYPLPIGVWIWMLNSLRRPMRMLANGQPVSADALLRARQRVINLPWWSVTVSTPGWLLCIPVFLTVLKSASGALHPHVL